MIKGDELRLDTRKKYEDSRDVLILILALSLLVKDSAPTQLDGVISDLTGVIKKNAPSGLASVKHGIKAPGDIESIPVKYQYGVGLLILTNYGLSHDIVNEYLMENIPIGNMIYIINEYIKLSVSR